MNCLIRPGTEQDVDSVVAAHASAFRGFFLTLLGPRFLALLYRAFVRDPDGCLLVAEGADARVIGFLAGARDPDRFFHRLRYQHGGRFALAAGPALLRHPKRVAERLLSAAAYRGDRPPELPGYWLLSSLGVHPDSAGRGVGSRLIERYVALAAGEGASGVYLLTDGRDNDEALHFYGRQHFGMQASLRRRDGRLLMVLTRSFTP